MKQNEMMNRLPGYDRMTQRSEAGAFLSLGLSGVMMVAFALCGTTCFVKGSNRIAATRTGQTATTAATAGENRCKPRLTNVTILRREHAPDQSLAPGKI